jgi:hypothetical protein
VFDFVGPVPSQRTAGYVDRLLADPSGSPVPIAGQSLLRVSFGLAVAHDQAGRTTAPGWVAFGLPNVVDVVRSGDFEAVVSYGIGLPKRIAFHMFTLTEPSRVVVDIGARFRTVLRRVYLFNQARFAQNKPPFVSRVLRPVLPGTPAVGAMDRLFAGPTRSESAASLRMLRSGATGYTALSVRDRVARVRLTGGCSSRGSTVSIADEIGPTLNQFPAVSFVKIFDPSGHTEQPSGLSDSIPLCLEP